MRCSIAFATAANAVFIDASIGIRVSVPTPAMRSRARISRTTLQHVHDTADILPGYLQLACNVSLLDASRAQLCDCLVLRLGQLRAFGATLFQSPPQRMEGHDANISAFATAAPSCLPRAVTIRELQDGPAPESLAGEL